PPARGSNDAGTSSNDSGDASSGPGDASSPPTCDPTKPFGAATPIAEVNTADEDIIVDMSPDELTMDIASNHDGTGVQLYSAKRATTKDPWSARQGLFPSGPFNNWSVTVHGDSAIVASDRSGNSELYLSGRTRAQGPFGPLTLLPGASSAAEDRG